MTMPDKILETEKTFVFLKPNAVRRGLVGEIIKRFEQRGLKICSLKMHKMTVEQANDLYAEHKGKSFFDKLIDFATGGPCVFMVVEGPRAVQLTRHLIGATDPLKADPGTIRADFSVSVTKNLIHASDSPESFYREHEIFFDEEDILSYKLDVQDDL